MESNTTQADVLNTVLLMSLQTYGRKRFIEDCVAVFRAEFNKEYIQHLKQIKKVRGTLLNKNASSSDKEYRWGVSIPNRLFNLINHYLVDPKFLQEKEELYWFMSKYDCFAIPEKI